MAEPLHDPEPSQVKVVCLPAAHVEGAQEVPVAYSLQAAEVPLHAPLVPQVAKPWSMHSFWGSWSPVMNPQAPLEPVPLSAAVHAMQVPEQIESQHTPSTQ